MQNEYAEWVHAQVKCRPKNEFVPDIKRRAKKALLESLATLVSTENVKSFQNDNVTLASIGVCTGLSFRIDKALQEIHPQLCILSSDTLTKFMGDIERDF